jgi:integrase
MNEIVIMWSLFAALDRKNSVQGEAAKLGQAKIQDLRPEHIQNLYSSLLDDEVGDYTIIKVHTVLHSALQQATHTGMIRRNPTSYVQPPKEPTTSLGSPIHPRDLLQDFKKLLKDVDLPVIRFHDLRHTAASLMLNNNIPSIVVSRTSGHAKASITLDIYSHLNPSMQVEAADKIDELILPVAVQLEKTNVNR